MRRFAVALLGLLILIGLPMPASRPALAATTVSGTLAGDTVWSASGSPYIVVDDVTVPSNVTLTIEPGVQVRFDTAPTGSHSIHVFGRIVSVGRPDLHVLFTSDAPFPDRNDWVSVMLDGSVGSVIEYTDFAWGSISLDIQRCSPRIANNSILESGLRAIQVIGPNAEPVIEHNYLATQLFKEQIGIVVQDADPLIRDNILQDNYYGIFVDGGSPRIENNTVRDGWFGFVAISASPVLVNNVIEGNGLAKFGGSGLLLSYTKATLRGNTIRNNAVGIDLPYGSRQTLAVSGGNVVNGIPLETLYHFLSRDEAVRGPDLDSGRSAGFTGNATQQGLLTFYDSVNVTVSGAWLRNNEALVYAANSSVLVENSTLTDSGNAFFLSGISQVVSLNNSFDVSTVNVTDERSALTVKNFLHVRALSDDARPIEGVRVRVTQDGLDVGDRTTGVDGWGRWLRAAYGVYSSAGGAPGLVLSLSTVRVDLDSPGRAFHDNPRTVNMSASRTEVFRQVDRASPRVLETSPANDSVGVALDARVTIVFSEPMNRTATEAAIHVFGYAAEDFAWTDGDRSVSFAIRGVGHGAVVFVEVGDGAADVAGNRLERAHLFTFDIERAPRRVDLTTVWIASIVLLAAGLSVLAWRRSRTRAESGGQEEGDREKEREA